MRSRISCVLVFLAAFVACAVHRNEVPGPQTMPSLLKRYIVDEGDTLILLRFTPPSWYDSSWVAVERCTGFVMRKPLTYYIAGRPVLDPSDFIVAFYHNNTATFGLGEEANRKTVAHEMIHHAIHHIIPPAPKDETYWAFQRRTHPAVYFESRCAHLL